MSLKLTKLERFEFFMFTIFIISFWLFFLTKILIFFGLIKFSNTLYNIEFFSFFLTVSTLVFLIHSLFEKKNKKEKEILEKTEQLELSLSAIDTTNVVVEFTPDGYIILINSKFSEVFGYNEEIIGKHHSILVPKKISNTKEYKQFWIELKDGKHKFDEFERISKTGNCIWISATYVPIKNKKGEVYKILKIAQDNSLSIKTQQELEKKNKYLEHAAKILRHDMHSGINTYIPRGIKSLKRRLTDEKIKELKIESPLRLIEEGLSHSQKVYSGVKEFTNLVKKDSKITKDVHNITNILKNYLKSTAYSSQVKIGDLGILEVNESLFCTAIDNLIRNGLKYNDSKTKMVSINRINNIIHITDNGRGMTKEEFEEYSKPYTRKKDNKESGSGLGLNICIAIMNEHGFKISSEKLKPNGTKITIEL